MSKALVVEDMDDIMPVVEDALLARGDSFEQAKSLEEARGMFSANDYAYVLLDLKIPSRAGGTFPDMSYGIQVLREIRQSKEKQDMPVIAMTSYVSDGFGISTELHQLGINACVSKLALANGTTSLVKVINDVLAEHASEQSSGRRAVAKTLTPFSAKKREMVIYEDHVTVCGVTVWLEHVRPDMRAILLALNKKERSRYVRINGTRLGKALDRNASNPVSRPIKDFRDTATELMANECGLECGSQDIIASGGGGYHFAECMVVREARAEAGKPEKAGEPEEGDGLNERQRKILEAIDGGEELRQKDVIAMFRRYRNPSTVKRDIKGLRDAGLIETHPDGYYTRSENNASARQTGSGRS